MSGNDQAATKRKSSDKRKYYASKMRKKTNQLEPGLTGFLVTCNYNEKQCLMECYDLLNHYAERLGLETTGDAVKREASESEDEDDFEAAFKKEVEEIKAKAGKKERNFQQVVTNVKNVLFIKSKLDDPIVLMDAILADLKAGNQKGSRHIMKMMPVVGTCRVDMDKLKQLIAETVPKYFSMNNRGVVTNNKGQTDVKEDSPLESEDSEEPCLFNIDFKARHNNLMDRHSTLKDVSALIQSLCKNAVVDYDSPDVTIDIQIVGKTLCLAILKDFKGNKKYNLQQLAIARTSDPCGKVPTEDKGLIEESIEDSDKNGTDNNGMGEVETGSGEVTKDSDIIGSEDNGAHVKVEQEKVKEEEVKEEETKGSPGDDAKESVGNEEIGGDVSQ